MFGEHGLHGVFFTEPLFSKRFGSEPLSELVGLIKEARQEVQLHLHTEWADETSPPLVTGIGQKRQFLCLFDRLEQTKLIGLGLELLMAAGVPSISAFRAGSFGVNSDTWSALSNVGIPFDSSYNGAMMPDCSQLHGCGFTNAPKRIEGVWEYPVTLFEDGTGRYRPAQVGACSFSEIEWLLWRAAENEWDSVVILMHNFELLSQDKCRPDPIVSARLKRLCQFLDLNSDAFETSGFNELVPPAVTADYPIPKSSAVRTGHRVLEQIWRRVYR
jgi:hypothetical protein